MKKSLLALLPIFLMPTITACQDVEHSIVPINIAFDDEVNVELTIDNFKALVDNKQQFVVEFYSPYCGHCEDLAVLTKKYMEETRNLIYQCDLSVLDEIGYNELKASYQDIFVDDYIPAIRFIKDGHLTFDVSRNKFDSYTALRSILNKHFLSSRINIVSSLKAFNTYKSQRSTHLAFAYDLDNSESLNFAANHLITSEFTKTDWAVSLLNCRDFEEDFAEIKNYYGASIDTFIAISKDGKITKIADYTASDFDFNSFIN